MTIQELKKNIESHNVSNDLIVFKYLDTSFLAHQYITEISKQHNLEIEYLTSLDTVSFIPEASNLSVYNVDKLDKVPINFEKFKNYIVVCKEIDSTLLESLSSVIVELPEVESWQVFDYLKGQLPGLNEAQLKKLYTMYGKDLFKLQLEIERYKILSPADQFKYFTMLDNKFEYDQFNVFGLVSAILNKNSAQINQIINSGLEINIFNLLPILIKNYKLLIILCYNNIVTANDLGITPNQFYNLKSILKKYSSETILKEYKLLCSIDYKIKSGQLTVSEAVDYILINLE